MITKCSTFIFGGVIGCGLDELAGSCRSLFLWEQVRDLRVQEFLKEIIVGVAALSNLAGSL